MYDGNGNVVALGDEESDLMGKYQYGLFGQPLETTSPRVLSHPFQWSSKYSIFDMTVVFFGYRYFDSSVGRWLSRDHPEEVGGKNLYAFVKNDGIGKLDFLRLWPINLMSLATYSWVTPQGYSYEAMGQDAGWIYISISVFDKSLDRFIADSAGRQVGEFASLVKAMAVLEGTSAASTWKPGENLADLFKAGETPRRGTAVATFSNENFGDHAAIFIEWAKKKIGKNPDGTIKYQFGFDACDQWVSGKRKHPGYRFIGFDGVGNSNNASKMHVVYTKECNICKKKESQ